MVMEKRRVNARLSNNQIKNRDAIDEYKNAQKQWEEVILKGKELRAKELLDLYNKEYNESDDLKSKQRQQKALKKLKKTKYCR